MRNLTAEEWMIVSGGHPSEQPNGEMQEVVVNGQKIRFRDPFSGVPWWVNATYWASMPYGMRPMGYHDDQGGGGEGSEDEGTPPDTDDTPDVRDVTCIDLKPGVTDLKAMHQLAVTVAKSAPLVSQTTPWGTFSIRAVEHGVMMYTLPGDPKVYSSERAIGTPDYIPNDEWYRVLSKMPAGAVIVGLWHSHPDKLALPSGYYDHPTGGGDWQFMKNLWAGQIGDSLMPLRVDPNATLYITGADGKTYVYDKSDYNRQGGMASGSKSCPVNKDG